MEHMDRLHRLASKTRHVHHEELAALSKELREEKGRTDLEKERHDKADVQHTVDLATLSEQLCLAIETKRVMGQRLVDIIREMEAMQRRHDQTLGEMRTHLARNIDKVSHARPEKGLATDGVSPDDEAAADVVNQLRQMEQERNELRGTLEWKEVNFEQQLEESLIKLLESEEALEQERRDKERLEVKLQETTALLNDALDRLASRRPDETGSHEKQACEGAAALETAQLRDDTTGFAVIWEHLRCPSRSSRSAPSSISPALADRSGQQNTLDSLPAMDASARSVSCQNACWRLVTSVSDLIALICSADSLQIQDASKQACKTWGSAALRGADLTSLLSCRRSEHQKLLRGKINGLCALKTKFSVEEYGCMEMCGSANRQPFDAQVICCHLPAEDELPAAVLVVFENLEGLAHKKKSHGK